MSPTGALTPRFPLLRHPSVRSLALRQALLLGLLYSGATAAQITLSWQDNSTNESGFKIERSAGGAGFAQIATVGANISNYTDSSVAQGGQYTYRVRAYNSAGDSAYSNTAVFSLPSNSAPTIGTIADQTLTVNGVTGPLPFTVGDAETAAGSLTLSATSSNTTLVPNGNIVFGGTGAARTIAVTPNGGATGSATITVKVSDGAASATRAFTVTVNEAPAVNTLPTISAIPDLTILVNKSSALIPFTVGSATNDAGSLRMSKESSNTVLVPTSAIDFGGSGANRTVKITPTAGKTGTATITATVRDGELRTSCTFTVTVTQAQVVNTAPTISSIGSQTLESGKAGSAIGFTIGDAETSTGSLTISASSNNTTLIPVANIAFGGSGSARTATITSATGKTGTANITITVSDGKLSASRTFTVTVKAPTNTAPTISAIKDTQILINKSSSTIRFTVGDAESDAGSLRMSKSSSNTSLIPTSGIVFGGSGADRTIKITPRRSKTGKATITATVRDGELETSHTFTVTVARSLSSSFVDAEVSTSKLVNASIRATAGSGDETLIAGFAVTGSDEMPVLVRALGPTLSTLGVSGAMADPSLSVVSGSEVAAANNNWASDDAVTVDETSDRVGAFELDPSSRDAVSIVNSRPGSYTAQVTSADAKGGVALIELYDAAESGNSQLTNLSGRGVVGTGDDVLILGFVIAGDQPRQVLIRGVGPSLAAHGVSGVLVDPQIALYQGSTLVDSNDNGAFDADVVKTAGQVGAFALSDASGRDAALLVTLPAGAYTAVLSGVADTTGVALLEIYDVEAIQSAQSPK